jgi:hypothetical protein
MAHSALRIPPPAKAFNYLIKPRRSFLRLNIYVFKLHKPKGIEVVPGKLCARLSRRVPVGLNPPTKFGEFAF